MSEKGRDWANILLNVHQSLRAEQIARTQQYEAAVLAAQAQQREEAADNLSEQNTRLRKQLAEIERKIAEEAGRGAEQSKLRDRIFTIRKAAESLAAPQGDNAEAILSKCTELARTAPPTSAFHSLEDKEYCHETTQLIAQKAAAAESAIEARVLAEREERRAQEQSRLRETIDTIRRSVESLPAAQGSNAEELISKCTELARSAPTPSAFDALKDKEYCQETVQLISQKAAEARRAIEARVLAQYEERIGGSASGDETNPCTVFFNCLELRAESPGEAMFEEETHKARLRELVAQLEARGDEARGALTPEEAGAIEFLRSGPQQFAAEISALAYARAENYHDRVMEVAQLVRRLRSGVALLSPHVRQSQRWVTDLDRWEQEVLRPHQDDLFQFKCMILAARADGDISNEESVILRQAGESIGLRRVEAEKIVAETKSLAVAEFSGDSKRARRVVGTLFDVACADGRLGKEEAAFIQKTGNALGIAEATLVRLWERSRLDYLNAQIPRLEAALESRSDAATLPSQEVPRIIRETLRAFGKGKLSVAPDIPAKKLANIVRRGVPSDEAIVALLDLTVFGSAKDAVVWGTRRFYWRLAHSSGPLSLTYMEMLRTHAAPATGCHHCEISKERGEVKRVREVLGAISPIRGGLMPEEFCTLFHALQRNLLKAYGWYVARGLDIEGPFRREHVLRVLRDRRVNRQKDLAWRPGMRAWTIVGDVPELRPEFTA